MSYDELNALAARRSVGGNDFQYYGLSGQEFARSGLGSGYDETVAEEIESRVRPHLARRPAYLRRQVVKVPAPAGKYQQVVRRLPTPTPDVVERVLVTVPERDVLNVVIEKPATPPPQIRERQVVAPPKKPIITHQVVSVQSRTAQALQYTQPRVTSYAPQPQVASYAAQPQVTSYAAQPQVASYAAQPQVASYAAQPQAFSYAAQPQVQQYATNLSYSAQPITNINYAVQPQTVQYVTAAQPAYLGTSYAYEPAYDYQLYPSTYSYSFY